MWPFSAGETIAASSYSSKPFFDYKERLTDRPCRLCGQGSEDIYHLVCLCPYPPMVAVRNRLITDRHTIVDKLWIEGLEAMESDHAPDVTFSPALSSAINNLRSDQHPVPADDMPLSDEDSILQYWLLLGVAWAEEAAAPSHLRVAALGRLFDAVNVKPRWMRRWSSAWLSWSERHLRHLAGEWRLACGLQRLPSSSRYRHGRNQPEPPQLADTT